MTDNPAASDFPSSSLNRRIVTTRPSAARIWNYWLGGRDYYEVDRRAGDEIRRLHPSIHDYARADRQFLRRAVRHLAAEVGIRQFLDIGAGLPTAENTHEVAQRILPDARIVYVDNDPLVLVHARALLTSAPEGRTDHVDEDVRNVDSILEHAARTLDLTRPVALMLLDVLAFVTDDEDPHGIVRRLMAALPAGSHLMLSHTVTSPQWPDVDIAAAWWNEHGTPRLHQRTPETVARFFDGLDLLEPGVVSCTRWRPDPTDGGGEPAEVAMFCGVGGKR
ncbi:SAM-dependent methyltransferase [Streptomyces caniscabiei]|uniref:SAM-dependent methyltransferase n=1 Tax=Streptomyces caniscabiei TaxID=2746961 RepID=A0A927QKI4_9ACTN|nr:SAM-dependent methyltransferase [Streptomyces caniscabiei]MBD9723899.1 SAM-dependent methyltransferase [Streptomyces caniscabiei]MDX3511448.1 SAM-dependent methyltransferase [Streptomyces caniscabiei]MDX3718371.1 SAM-dependent methyltransferase [Streptomyces caniscabiei]MDX3727022.1 SAM-dependent methyltransferase [Streptomyces caniscabiei]WEO22216.1 SAM-dependent methyltransferase [Streptomyces caniscabiei]